MFTASQMIQLAKIFAFVKSSIPEELRDGYDNESAILMTIVGDECWSVMNMLPFCCDSLKFSEEQRESLCEELQKCCNALTKCCPTLTMASLGSPQLRQQQEMIKYLGGLASNGYANRPATTNVYTQSPTTHKSAMHIFPEVFGRKR